MSTYSDTVRISLATPDDIRELAERNLHLWVGASSPLWAPFWTAASFGIGLWSLGQAMARTMGDTIYDRDVSLALKWPGFEALPKPVDAHPLEPTSEIVEKTADIVEDVVAAAGDAVEKTEAVAAEAAETAVDSVMSAEPVTEFAKEAEAVVADTVEIVQAPIEETQDAAETVAEGTVAATSATAKASAQLAKKAAAATLDLLGQPAVSAGETRPLIDPVTEKPVIPAVIEATAEPKLPMPKPAPRRPRKG
jgi:hypothetical protein